MKDDRLEKLAEVLVNYSTGVKAGDRVAISAEDCALPFVKAVAKAATKAGGIVEYYIDVPEVDAEVLKNGSEEQYAKENIRFGACASSDVWLSAWGTANVKTFQSIAGEKLKQRRLANKENRKIYSKRMGDGSLRWCGTQFPTNGDAQNAGMSLDEYEEFVYRAGYLYEADPVAKWCEIEALQDKWVDFLDGHEELHIITKDTDIRVGIKGRKWINCCGKENFPDGEVFTSPEEDNINGYITFSYPSIMNGNEFENVRLDVKDGKIVGVTCKNMDMLPELMSYIDTDAGSRFFGEVAIGTNYGIQQHSKNILFDEKIGGSVHMAIGESFQEAGGKNESSIHWDMITSMRDGGKIYIDGILFYENGEFKDEFIKKK
ncbi:aminopeptidase [Chakrabartyella piscis]|uniref:aminopeptidase n=1 Tax=Chakrabartyella piscis TaxID=2918914 RepID=UPI002958AE1E|nr:aminopeptidase [Chakrabartyella piscis]